MKAGTGHARIMNNRPAARCKGLTLLLCGILSTATVKAQHFSWKSRVAPVSNTGFYTIPLSPELTAFSQEQWRDLRLIDDQKKEIPYLLKQSERRLGDAPFVSYTITDQQAAGSLQYLVVANPAKARIDHILLEMASADATRTISISGSNDQQAWFVVRDTCYFNALGETPAAQLYKEVTFPLTEYAFYKITIHNGKQQPLNITRAGYFEQQQTIQATCYRVPGISFTQKDGLDKRSYIRISCQPANRISRLVLHIAAPAQYHRTGTIRAGAAPDADKHTGSSPDSRRMVAEYDYPVELASDKDPWIDIKALAGDAKCGYLDIEINNQDNQPLRIDSISAYQPGAYLVAQLEKDKTYDLCFGDTALAIPEYDIVYFQNKLPEAISSVATGPVTANEPALVLKKGRDNSRYMVWLGLGVAGIAIALMTTRMIRDMNKGR